MLAVLSGLLPCWGMAGCWQMFTLCFLSAPLLLYRGSLESHVLGGIWLVDDYNGSLIFLSFWLGALMMISTHPRKSLCIWGVVCCCFLAFSSFSFFWFYVFFELSLFPVFVLIVRWGVQPERVSAVFYLMLYTLAGSLPFLLFILHCFSLYGSFFMGFSSGLLGGMGIWSCIAVVVFFIKMPCYPFHLWLTKAHVEAPTAGSMALAGLLLKLGGVGLMRVLGSYGQLPYKMEIFWGSAGMWGGILSSLVCLRQMDTKSLVAYSSVGHMSLVQLGILSGSSLGWTGALYMMVAHGLCSSGLFSILGEYYKQVKTRNMSVMTGLGMLFPSVTIWWCILIVCSMSCPPGLGFLSEIFMGMSIVSIFPGFALLFSLMGFLAGAYSLILYSGVVHGTCCSSLRPPFGGITKCSYLGLFHGAPLFFLFFFPGIL
uniref:NADH dehydrogenase subunit 4 n=1 Tax=Mimachlamys varia TaxID=50417 RepID=UPI001FA709C8|nr:NADH dehydrogenase subunit 4 [Mimachlamys varia]UNA71554.1 NADH dehydrogenase subunit 4 [Mimachlamys varia]